MTRPTALSFLAGALCAALVAFSVAPGTPSRRFQYKLIPYGEARAAIEKIRASRMSELRLKVSSDDEAMGVARMVALREWLVPYAKDGWRVADARWHAPVRGADISIDDGEEFVVLVREPAVVVSGDAMVTSEDDRKRLVDLLQEAAAENEKKHNGDYGPSKEAEPAALCEAAMKWFNWHGDAGDLLVRIDDIADDQREHRLFVRHEVKK